MALSASYFLLPAPLSNLFYLQTITRLTEFEPQPQARTVRFRPDPDGSNHPFLARLDDRLWKKFLFLSD
jgi:hypothetical protein